MSYYQSRGCVLHIPSHYCLNTCSAVNNNYYVHGQTVNFRLFPLPTNSMSTRLVLFLLQQLHLFFDKVEDITLD